MVDSHCFPSWRKCLQKLQIEEYPAFCTQTGTTIPSWLGSFNRLWSECTYPIGAAWRREMSFVEPYQVSVRTITFKCRLVINTWTACVFGFSERTFKQPINNPHCSFVDLFLGLGLPITAGAASLLITVGCIQPSVAVVNELVSILVVKILLVSICL